MTEEYITTPQAIEMYNLNKSKLQFALQRRRENGLYKCIYSKRTRIFLRKDYFEKWLEDNDIVSPSRVRTKTEKTTRLQSRRPGRGPRPWPYAAQIL